MTTMTASRESEKEHGKGHAAMNTPPIVSQQEWEAARQQLLVKEKALTRSRDALAAERRRMPWMAVEKKYEFDGPKGKVSLLDLFEGRRQLIVYRAFFEPGVFGWPEHACRGCSLGADQVGHLAHLNARDTTLAYASRAPQADIARLKARMGWKMPWYTITDSFDADFGVDEWHGHNAFIRDGDQVFRTYFINNRGDEAMGTIWSYLDMTRARPSGDLGGLAGGLPADPAVQMVELARQLRRRGRARPEVGRYPHRPSRSRPPQARGGGERLYLFLSPASPPNTCPAKSPNAGAPSLRIARQAQPQAACGQILENLAACAGSHAGFLNAGSGCRHKLYKFEQL